MAEKAPQTRDNHTRLDPLFHFFLLPVTFLLLIWCAIHLYRHPSKEAMFITAIDFLLLLTIFKARTYALKVQDRVIRLEERLRLGELLQQSQQTLIPALTEKQLIALRFACDAELPNLAAKAVDEKLNSKQIKGAIQTWRPDYWRV